MPVTGFHVGIGVLAKGCSARRFSLIGFCLTQMAIDVESGYYLFFGGWPLHRGMHTLLGATLVCVVLLMGCRWLSTRRGARPKNVSGLIDEDLACLRSPTGLLTTGALSILGHVIPDAVMHGDVRPFAPISDANPLFAVVPLPILHWALVISGVVGSVLMLGRWARRGRNRR
jgi:hypothetical protein